jgi:hypothetical protein
MAHFEQSHERHVVHELHRPQGHGYADQKYDKGNLAPIRGSVPSVDYGAVPGADGAGAPGMPAPENGTGASGAQ